MVKKKTIIYIYNKDLNLARKIVKQSEITGGEVSRSQRGCKMKILILQS